MVAPGKTTKAGHDDGEVNHDSLVNKSNKVAPGKLTGPSPVQVNGVGKQAHTGSDFADNGAVCEAGGAGCFLSDAQRSRLILLFEGRVLDAHMEYMDALSELRVDTLAEKDSDLSWVLELVLSVISIAATAAISKAILALKNTDKIANALDNAEIRVKPEDFHFEDSLASQAVTQFKAVTDAKLAGLIKKGTDKAGKKAAAAAKDATNTDHKTKKQEELSYIDTLKGQSAYAYKAIREEAPATLDDAGLLALFTSFDPSFGHTSGVYKQKLKVLIDRYTNSFVHRMGETTRKGTHAGAGGSETPTHGVQTKIIFLVNATGGQPTLMYQIADTHSEWVEGHWNPTFKNAVDGKFGYYAVEAELRDIAIAKHVATWHAPPEIIMVDDRFIPKWHAIKKPPPLKDSEAELVRAQNAPDRPTNTEEAKDQ